MYVTVCSYAAVAKKKKKEKKKKVKKERKKEKKKWQTLPITIWRLNWMMSF
jgi:hypothetical protein